LAKHVAAKYNLTVHAFSDEEESPSSITISSGHELEPSPITPTMIDPFTPYSVLSGTTRALFGEDIIVSPGIMSGNTDISALNISFINVFD
jgi:Gly-Xaa carboxypeptidase